MGADVSEEDAFTALIRLMAEQETGL
jgi:hypothetical protein